MECEEVCNHITDCLTGSLPEDILIEFQRHVATCDSCTAEIETIQTTWERLGALPSQVSNPESMRRNFDAMVDRHRQMNPDSASARKRTGPRWVGRLWPRRPVFQFVFVMALLVGAVFAAQQTNVLVTLRIIPAPQSATPPVVQKVDPLPDANSAATNPSQPIEEPASLEGVLIASGTGQPIARANVFLELDGLDAALGIPSGQNAAFKQGYLSAMRTDSPALVEQSLGGLPFQLTVASDENGRFVFSNIKPGRYLLSAMRNGFISVEYGQRTTGSPGLPIVLAGKQALKDIRFAMTPASVVAGHVYDPNGDPISNATVRALKYAYQNGQRTLTIVRDTSTNDIGEYRLADLEPGRYILSASQPQGPLFVGAGNGKAYPPVFYPGVVDPASASSVDVTAASTVSAMNLKMMQVPAARVSGRIVTDSSGKPASQITVRLIPRLGHSSSPVGSRSVMTNDNGTFEFTGVASGNYYLVASLESGRGYLTPAGIIGQQFSRSAAFASIDVMSNDIPGLAMVLQAGFDVPGKIDVEGPASPVQPKTIHARIKLLPLTPVSGPGAPVIGDDGAFTVKSLLPGEYRLALTGLPRNVYLKSAQLDGVDVLNSPLRLDRVPAGELHIALATNAAALDTTVLDNKQNPLPGVTIVIVPDAPMRERYDLYRNVSTDAAGHAHFDGIAPGNYKVFAWESAEAGSWTDPDFLRTYEDRGKAFRAVEGAKGNIDLKMITTN